QELLGRVLNVGVHRWRSLPGSCERVLQQLHRGLDVSHSAAHRLGRLLLAPLRLGLGRFLGGHRLLLGLWQWTHASYGARLLTSRPSSSSNVLRETLVIHVRFRFDA